MKTFSLKKLLSAFLISTAGLSLSANSHASFSRDSFCKLTYSDFQTRAEQQDFRLTFDNPPSWMNTGSCWWDSRFQRAAIYLTVPRPDLPPPSDAEAAQLIQKLISGNQIVELPGYGSFMGFSYQYSDWMIRAIEAWKAFDLLTLVGYFSHDIPLEQAVPEQTLAQRMASLDEQVNRKHLIPLILIRPQGDPNETGIHQFTASHALLVTHLRAARDGYTGSLIDSNFPDRDIPLTYADGADVVQTPEGTFSSFVFREDFDDDFVRFNQAHQQYCGKAIE
jgi:hypothetical protein